MVLGMVVSHGDGSGSVGSCGNSVCVPPPDLQGDQGVGGHRSVYLPQRQGPLCLRERKLALGVCVYVLICVCVCVLMNVCVCINISIRVSV